MNQGQVKSKLFIIVLSVSFLLFGISWVFAGHAPKLKKKETKIVQIRGNQAWVNTGIQVRPQDTVTIKASGKVYFSNEESVSGVDPDGWGIEDYMNSWPYNHNYCNDPEMGMSHCALIGNVGHPNFFVGRRLIFSGKNGALYLGINDCTLNGEYRNSGKFTAIITVNRGTAPTRK